MPATRSEHHSQPLPRFLIPVNDDDTCVKQPLMLAKSIKVSQLLIDHNANVNQRCRIEMNKDKMLLPVSSAMPKDFSVLHLAMIDGNVEKIKLSNIISPH